VATERAPAANTVTPGVAFEVERFEWTSPDRLELVGRWVGLRGQRFLRPTLDVEVGGERRRMLAVLEHKPWASEDGQDWIAAFDWRGEPGNFDDAELTVSPDLAVQLPPPGGSVAHGELPVAAAGDRRPARRPRSAVLEAELAAALAEVERVGEELERTRRSHSEAARELRERVRAEHARIRALEAELEQARAHIEGAESTAAEQADRLRDERDAVAAERDAAVVARDAAVAEADDARGGRDDALQKLSAAEAERDALAEARDRARHERNAWMSRARAAAAGRPGAEARAVPKPLAGPVPDREPGPTPAPPAEEPATVALPPAARRTIQIGERPGPLAKAPPVSLAQDRGRVSSLPAWAARLAAALALAVLVVLVLLLLAGAI
jgi:hypothetical protein